MLISRLNLEDFPDSPYAQELGRGASKFSFTAALEAEYAPTHLQRVQLRIRVWFSLNVVLAALFTVDQLRRDGLWTLASVAHVGAVVPCTIALAWLAWSRQYMRFYLSAAPVLVTVFGALIAIFVAIALTAGRDELLSSLTVNLVANFFFCGLMFRHALLTSAFMVLAFAVAALAAGVPYPMLVKSLVILTLTFGISAVVYRDVEQSYRRNFLGNALIGELVSRDGLTGLMNRRSFDEHLLRVWHHALRDQRSLAVLMIDIDHFKEYNDEFGHQAGDLALRGVGKIIQGFSRRPLDLAARYGGEEFAVILYDLPLPYVSDMAGRLREAVQSLSRSSEITVSVGIGLVIPICGRMPEGAVQLADEALYEAKRAGRNRVVVKDAAAYKLLDTGAFNAARKARA